MKFKIITFLSLLTPLLLMGQQRNNYSQIRGHLINPTSSQKSPIAHASIFLHDLGLRTQSDVNGNFHFDVTPFSIDNEMKSDFRFSIYRDGYEPIIVKQMAIRADGELATAVSLHPKVSKSIFGLVKSDKNGKFLSNATISYSCKCPTPSVKSVQTNEFGHFYFTFDQSMDNSPRINLSIKHKDHEDQSFSVENMEYARNNSTEIRMQVKVNKTLKWIPGLSDLKTGNTVQGTSLLLAKGTVIGLSSFHLGRHFSNRKAYLNARSHQESSSLKREKKQHFWLAIGYGAGGYALLLTVQELLHKSSAKKKSKFSLHTNSNGIGFSYIY